MGQTTKLERDQALAFFTNLQYILPCKICRAHYAKHLSLHPPAVQTRDTLSRWLHNIHNIVNVNTGKPQVPYEHVKEHYMGGEQRLAEEDEVCSLKSKIKTTAIVNCILGGLLTIGVLVIIVKWVKEGIQSSS